MYGLQLCELFTYPNNFKNKGVQITEGLLYCDLFHLNFAIIAPSLIFPAGAVTHILTSPDNECVVVSTSTDALTIHKQNATFSSSVKVRYSDG